MWLNNITVYQIHPTWRLSVDTWDTLLSRAAFVPLMKGEEVSNGFVHPEAGRVLRDAEAAEKVNPYRFVHPWGGREGLACALLGEKRSVPADVLEREVRARVNKIEDGEKRTLHKRERDQIKDEAKRELLSRAFSRFGLVYVGVDFLRSRLLIGSASKSEVEAVKTHLRRGLGMLPIYHWATVESPAITMREWVLEGPPDEVWLHGPVTICDTERQGTWKGADPQDDVIVEPLKNRMLVEKIGINLAGDCGFFLDESLTIRKYHLDEVKLDVIGRDLGKSAEDMDFGATVELAMGEARALLDTIEDWFGGRNAEIPEGMLSENERQELLDLEKTNDWEKFRQESLEIRNLRIYQGEQGDHE